MHGVLQAVPVPALVGLLPGAPRAPTTRVEYPMDTDPTTNTAAAAREDTSELFTHLQQERRQAWAWAALWHQC
jgi:hypothetical protein